MIPSELITDAIRSRFMRSHERATPSGCWLWTLYVAKNGYGKMMLRDESGRKICVRAHRMAWRLFRGKVPKELDHTCEVRRCVNPWHLEPVTHRENMLRGKTFAASNFSKAECPRGHSLIDDSNVYWRADRPSHRECLYCKREAARNHYHSRRV